MNYSRQREEVLSQLQMHHDHPTADVIFAELRERNPNISLATVYRNLRLLSEQGTIQKIGFVSGADHFDPNALPHYHFVCNHCGRVIDVPMEVAEHLNEQAQRYISGKVMSHELVFHGLCEECSGEYDSI